MNRDRMTKILKDSALKRATRPLGGLPGDKGKEELQELAAQAIAGGARIKKFPAVDPDTRRRK